MNKSTKRNIIFSSVLAIVLCVSMICGGTFALFTDTTKVSVNKIQAGTLNVQLVDADGNDLEGKTLKFKKAAGHEDEEVLWEPGCTYELPAVYIKNSGNLSLKYKIVISGIEGDEGLNEVIEWTVGGLDIATEGHLAAGEKSEALTIKGHMKEDAGNEYQGLSIDGVAITVLATQDTVEYDSNGNTYDENAKYSKVTNQAEFLAALNSATDGETINMTAGNFGMLKMLHCFTNGNVKNIKLVGEEGTSIGLWFGVECAAVEGWTFENINFIGADYGLTLDCINKDVTVKNCSFTGGRFGSAQTTGLTTNLTIVNCKFKNTAYDDANKRSAVYISNNNGVIIENCTFENAGFNAIQLGEMQGNVTIEGNNINGTHDRALRFTKAAANASVILTIKNNIVTNAKDGDNEVLKANSKNYTINISGNTWDGHADAEMTITDSTNYVIKLPN